jgi:HNH endonuclease
MGDPRITAQQRREVGERARGCCEYCRSQVRFAMSSFVVDHIVPRSAGGATHTDNLALACSGCNAHKYNKTSALDPVSGETVMLYHPRRDRFRDHFTWSDDFTRILGITPSGRATVEALHMNHDGVTNLRRLLHEAGSHPPSEPEA